MFQFFQIVNPVIPPSIGSGGNSIGPTATGSIIAAIVGLMYVIGFLTALIYLITGGFYWITSAGEKNNLESARNRITQAIVGLIVIFSTYAVMSLLATFVGWSEFPKLPIPTLTGSTSSPGGSNYGPGGCSYAANGGYACYTTSQCVQCVNGATNWSITNKSNCPAPCNQ